MAQSVIRPSPRLVILDVVVTDNKGQPVIGLKAEDFTMLEEGRRKRSATSSFQHPGMSPAPAARPLPPDLLVIRLVPATLRRRSRML